MKIKLSELLKYKVSANVICKTVVDYKNREYELFDGEGFVTFDIIDVNLDKMIINLAITKQGKISVLEYDLKDCDDPYFEYGLYCERIYLTDFEEVA